MKLRILGDTLRLRLSQSDVQTLASTGRIEETTHFGAGRSLVYAVARDANADAIAAKFEDAMITVHVPDAALEAWADTEEVSMRAEQSVEDGRTLALLIEKDFKCAIVREGEEDYDGFANPNVTC